MANPTGINQYSKGWSPSAKNAASIARKARSTPKTSKGYGSIADTHRAAFALAGPNSRLREYHKAKAFAFDKLAASAGRKESSAKLKEWKSNRSKVPRIVSRSK